MKLTTLSFFSFILAFAMSSCDKHKHDHEKDTSTPVITISKPLNLEVYSHGDTIRIQGKFEDNEMHEAVVSLMDDTTNAVLFSYAPYAHEKSLVVIDTFWKANVTKNSKATLLFQAVDHANNTGTANRKITINK